MKYARLLAEFSTRLAIFITLLISLGAPSIFCTFVFNAESSSLNTGLEITMANINRVIRLNPLLCRYDLETLKEALNAHRPNNHDNAYIVLPDGYKTIEINPHQTGPFISGARNLTDAGKTVAQLVVRRSIKPLIQQTFVIFLLSAVVSLALFFPLRTLPHYIIKRAETEIMQLAYYDPLTALPNRALINDRLEQVIQRAGRDKYQAAVVFLDLDHFKNINESMGHNIGDQLLKQVAVRLEQCLRGTDSVARYGGDEFIILLPQIPTDHEKYVSMVARKIIKELETPVKINGRELYTSCSIGISIFPLDGHDGQSLLKHADLAMYQAKKRGRKNYQFFSMDLNRKAHERMQLETSLREALAQGHLYLQYQPKLNLKTGHIGGVEVLTRWQHPEMGLISPDHFIPLAEETGIINPLGHWILLTACMQHQEWRQTGLAPPPLSVNLSIRQLQQHDFNEQVVAALQKSGLDPDQLELELTESCLMESSEDIINKLSKLRKLGIRIAIDDFGTGYSSLGYLKHFPVDRLKIDRCFVKDINTSISDNKIAQAIIAMAKSLSLQVTAEGVELEEQQNILHEHGCDEIQGYFYSRPLSTRNMEEFLVKEHETIFGQKPFPTA